MAGPSGADTTMRHYSHDAWNSISSTIKLPDRGACLGALAPVLTPSEPGERRSYAVVFPILPFSRGDRQTASGEWAADMGEGLRGRLQIRQLPRPRQRDPRPPPRREARLRPRPHPPLCDSVRHRRQGHASPIRPAATSKPSNADCSRLADPSAREHGGLPPSKRLCTGYASPRHSIVCACQCHVVERFNSSLAHNDVWSPDYIKSPLTRTSVLISCGLSWTRMALRGLPFPTYSPRHPGRGERRRRRPLSTRPSAGRSPGGRPPTTGNRVEPRVSSVALFGCARG